MANPDGARGSMVASGRTEETFWMRGDHQIQGHVPELQAPAPITEPELAGWTGLAVTDRWSGKEFKDGEEAIPKTFKDMN